MGCPYGEGNGCDEPKSQLHTCLEGKVIEIRNFFVWGGGILAGEHQVEVVGFAAAGLTLVAAFFLVFPAARLGPAVNLGSGSLGLAVVLVAVTLGCLGASVTG